MSEKQELIRKMLQMQKDFIAQEQQGGIDPKDYFAPEGGHPLSGFRESYAITPPQGVDLAPEEKGSKRWGVGAPLLREFSGIWEAPSRQFLAP